MNDLTPASKREFLGQFSTEEPCGNSVQENAQDWQRNPVRTIAWLWQAQGNEYSSTELRFSESLSLITRAVGNILCTTANVKFGANYYHQPFNGFSGRIQRQCMKQMDPRGGRWDMITAKPLDTQGASPLCDTQFIKKIYELALVGAFSPYNYASLEIESHRLSPSIGTAEPFSPEFAQACYNGIKMAPDNISAGKLWLPAEAVNPDWRGQLDFVLDKFKSYEFDIS